jgi:predicted metalloprotease
MDLNNLRETSNFDDRRGEGAGGFGGGAGWGGGFGGLPMGLPIRGGGLGFVGFILLLLLFGNGGGGLLSAILGGGETNTGSGYSQQATGADHHDNDPQLDFSRKIVASTEDVWTPIMQARGVTFTPAVITFYTTETPTACGDGQASAGPFYCPADKRIYLDLSFFDQLSSQFGAPGDFARAYVIAHEYGHHIQNLIGTMDKEESALQGDGAKGPTGASVRLELQADCYAGVWAFHARDALKITQSDIEGGLKAAAAVGDDTLEKEQQGYVVPDSFTHGTSEQRMRWFSRGYANGNMDDCDTFGASEL